MNSEWSLDALYKGINDPALAGDMEKLSAVSETYKELTGKLPDPASQTEAEKVKTLRNVIDVKEELTILSRRLGSYFSLRRSANATDAEGSAYLTKIHGISASLSSSHVAFEKYAGSIKDLQSLLDKDEVLKDYHFYFSEIQESVSHRLSDEAEGIMAQMNITGGMAWGDQANFLASKVKVDYQGETITLPAVRGMAASEDPAVRKAAYEAEIKAYDLIKDPIAFSLNSIKQQVTMEAGMRGYESPLAMTLVQSRMKKETLDALMKAMDESLPRFRAYLKHKATLLGHKNGLPWYDILAPMGDAPMGDSPMGDAPMGEPCPSDKPTDKAKYTIEDAKAYLIEHFSHFAPDIAAMMERAFDEGWIDFYPRNGKRGGAFCSNLPFIQQSRVLTNFTGEFGDIVTLAHELGHAYHGQQIQNCRPLNWGYSMPVAETASNFNELVVMNDAISKASGGERIRLIESQVQDCTQIIVDILSRFLFEDAVFSRSKDRFLYADDLCDIMLDAQKQAFGDGLDPEVLHPYMWCCKTHYYSTGRSYYNFPYAFGGLFSRGIYARYLEEGESFLPKYREMLKATTSASCEDVARIAGIDLTDVNFWRSSLAVIDQGITEFLNY